MQCVTLRECVQQLAHAVQVDPQVVPRFIAWALRPEHIGKHFAFHPAALAGQIDQQAGRQAGGDTVVRLASQLPLWYIK